MLNSKASKVKDGLLASYEISKIIAKAGKPHYIGETVILLSFSVVISSVMKQNANVVTNSIPLSNSSLSRRIDEMAEDVEKQLIAKLKVKQFALQLDESILRDNEAILFAHVRYKDDEGPREEVLFARSLMTDTRGEKILNEANAYLEENNIPLRNTSACATDGAPSMTGRYKGFIAYLKNAIHRVFCIHGVIHRQYLVAKKLSGCLHDALHTVIIIVKNINSKSLRDCRFRELCNQNGEDFERLAFHTEMRWLLK